MSKSQPVFRERNYKNLSLLTELKLLNSGIEEDCRVPWTARRSNQSILKEINPKYSLEGLMLKLQYAGQLMRRVNSLKKDPDARKD